MPAKTVGAVAVSALVFAAPVAAAPGDDSPVPTTARLTSIALDLTDQFNYPTGKLTATAVTGGAPLTIRPALFAKDVYLTSAGFGDTRPDSVQQWDEAIDKLSVPDNSPSPAPPFAAIGNTQELMKLAAQLPAKTIVVSYVPDSYDPKNFSLVTLQPVAE